MDHTSLPSVVPQPVKPPPTDISRQPRSNGGQLLLIRKTWGGWYVPFIVKIDGHFAGRLRHGESSSFFVPEGEHVLEVYGGGTFFGATDQFVVWTDDVIKFTVRYSWKGGTLLTKVS